MISGKDRSIRLLIEDIREGKLLLPEVQRAYVWKTTQVRDFIDSLYREYPSGQIMVWETDDLPSSATRSASIEGVSGRDRRPQLLLDGQQRLTSLAAVILKRPVLVDGHPKLFDIAFNVFSEKFEVAGPRQPKQSGWILLSKFFEEGTTRTFRSLDFTGRTRDEEDNAFAHLLQLEKISSYEYRVIVLEKLSYDVVTDIFVRINSGGTRLGGADLALAQVSSRWQGVTTEFTKYLDSINDRGLKGLKLDSGFLLRSIVALVTGQSGFDVIYRVDRQPPTVEDLKAGWIRVKAALNHAIDFIVHNCFIDRLELLPTNNVLIPLVVFFDKFGTDVTPTRTQALQRWVYMALIWTRYSTASETALDQDISALTKSDPVQTLIQNVETKAGRGRQITEEDLRGQRSNSPFMLMAYVLARMNGAQDWFNGVVIGGTQSLEFHHIFPKALLRGTYDLRKDSRKIDQVANLAFLSDKANSRISKHAPNDYLPTIDKSRLNAQNIPMDSDLWTIAHFDEFMTCRRELLADSINQLIRSLSEPQQWEGADRRWLETRIDAIEEQLRDLIDLELSTQLGTDSWKSIPKDIKQSAERLIEERITKNPSEKNKYDTLRAKLKFCLFSHLGRIITTNWSLFEDIFGKNATIFEQHFNSATKARNALKHNQEMNRNDRDLAHVGLNWLEDSIRAAARRAEEDEEEDMLESA